MKKFGIWDHLSCPEHPRERTGKRRIKRKTKWVPHVRHPLIFYLFFFAGFFFSTIAQRLGR